MFTNHHSPINILKLIFIFFLFLNSYQSYSQTDQSWNQDQKEIHQVIISLFDGMREGDSSKVHTVFHDDVRMITALSDSNGNSSLRKGSLKKFLKAVGTPHDQIWNEKIYDPIIQIDGSFAQVWTDYSFFLGEDLSHCGIDAFQLLKIGEEWKIISLADTRRKTDCHTE